MSKDYCGICVERVHWAVNRRVMTSTSRVFAGMHLNAAIPALIINTYHNNRNNRAPTYTHTHALLMTVYTHSKYLHHTQLFLSGGPTEKDLDCLTVASSVRFHPFADTDESARCMRSFYALSELVLCMAVICWRRTVTGDVCQYFAGTFWKIL